VVNNVFHTAVDTPGGSTRAYISVGQADDINGFTIDNNSYYPDRANAFIISSTGYNFATWKAATGKCAHSVASDPLFVNAPGRDFHLQSGSSCIGAGMVVAGVAQQGAKPNIGAY
jgi:hypothetical protein